MTLLVGVALLRLCALLLVAELSGVAHMGIDLVGSLTGVERHDIDDCDDAQGHECPPGCPDCHCWRGAPGTASVLRLQIDAPFVAIHATKASIVPYAGMQLAGSDPESPYRPPRPSTLS